MYFYTSIQHTSTSLNAQARVCMFYVHTYIHIYIYIYIYVCMYVCMYVYTHMYVYMYIHIMNTNIRTGSDMPRHNTSTNSIYNIVKFSKV